MRQYEDSASALPLALVTHGTELGTTVSRSTALIFDLHSGWTLVALAPFLSRCSLFVYIRSADRCQLSGGRQLFRGGPATQLKLTIDGTCW